MPEFLDLPERSVKPRQTGITHVLDKGLGPRGVQDLLAVAAGSVDIVKLGWGTAAVTSDLKAKVGVYQEAGVPVCLGGTLLEVVLRQNKLNEYVAWVKELGIDHVEVSDGTIALDHDAKLDIIRRLTKEFTVLSEVGSKSEDVIFSPKRWVEMIQKELEAGSWKVITEGRESGTVGVYQPGGEVKEGLIDEIRSAVDPAQLLFEAPIKKQQSWFIKQFGANVNLGNIPPDEVISVETLRVGVRGDTLLHFHGA